MTYGVKYVIKSINKEKNIKKILKVCPILSIKIDGEFLSFCVAHKNCSKVEKLLLANNITIIKKSSVGALPFLKSTILRWGVIIPIVLFTLVCMVANMYIFNYSVIGNELVSTQEIMQVLSNQNIVGIVKKKNINKIELESALRDIDKVSLVSVAIKGNTLIINIKEKVYNQEYENKNQFEPLKSEFNGIITEISLVQGTPLVKVGQTVKVGQSLIAPYVVNKAGQTLSVKPMADIKADVFYTTSTQVPNTKIQMIDTGKTVVKKQITLFGLTLYSNNVSNNFNMFRQQIIEQNITSGVLLPIKIVTTVYYEQTEQQTNDYFNTNKQQILLECQQKTRQFVGSCEIIKEEYKTITQIADINQITYTVVVNKSIC